MVRRVFLSFCLVALPLLWLFVSGVRELWNFIRDRRNTTVDTLLHETIVEDDEYDHAEEEILTTHSDDEWQDTQDIIIIDEEYKEDDNIIEEKIIILEQSNPDQSLREHAYRERFRTDLAYAKKKEKRDEYEKKLIEWYALDPWHTEVISTLADYYCQHRQLKKALPLFKKIVEQHPDDHKALRHMAEIYLESKDYETAEFLTKQALSLSSQNPKYAVTLTEIYYNTGRMEDAIATMEEVVKRRPSRIGYWEALAKLYEEIRDYEFAEQCYQAILEINSLHIGAKKKILEMRSKL